MQALLLEKPKNFRFIDTPEPGAALAGEAVVRVHAVGICGTDYGGYLGKMPFFSYPRIPGHELGVEVVAVGPGVTNVKPGDRCCVDVVIEVDGGDDVAAVFGVLDEGASEASLVGPGVEDLC